MFCPKCATQNLEGASFCRACGANISLVPQAISGQLPVQQQDDSLLCVRGKRKEKLSLDVAFKNIFIGVAFFIISLALARSIGRGWWFWMLIPAFAKMGVGIAQFIRLRANENQPPLVAPPHQTPQAFPSANSVPSFTPARPRNTGDSMAPVASVTEGTTRHLGVDAKTRHLDSSNH